MAVAQETGGERNTMNALDNKNDKNEGQKSALDQPQGKGQGTYSDGCMSCGAVAPIAAGTEEGGYQCGACAPPIQPGA